LKIQISCSFSINGKTLPLQGSFSSSANGWLQANGASSLAINTTGNFGDTLDIKIGQPWLSYFCLLKFLTNFQHYSNLLQKM
jgi:hypothetical protein